MGSRSGDHWPLQLQRPARPRLSLTTVVSSAQMDIRVPETHKKPGVTYAVTDDGIELPVIDITHPAFTESVTDAELAARTDEFMREIEARKKRPRLLTRLFMRLFLRKS